MARKPHTQDLSVAFKALGNPNRLAIVRELLERELACCTTDRVSDCTLDPASCNVGGLGASLTIDASTLSHHLKELDHAELIERARRGRQIYCRIHRGRMEQLRLFLTPNSAGTHVRIGKRSNTSSLVA